MSQRLRRINNMATLRGRTLTIALLVGMTVFIVINLYLGSPNFLKFAPEDREANQLALNNSHSLFEEAYKRVQDMVSNLGPEPSEDPLASLQIIDEDLTEEIKHPENENEHLSTPEATKMPSFEDRLGSGPFHGKKPPTGRFLYQRTGRHGKLLLFKTLPS